MTLALLCGHLLALVGPKWAYKRQTHTFVDFMKVQGGTGEEDARRPRGGCEEAARNQWSLGRPSLLHSGNYYEF